MALKGQKFRKYLPSFKLEVAEAYLNGEGSYLSLARKYNLDSKLRVRDWAKIYKEKGSEGFLIETRGRNSKSEKTKPINLEDMSLKEQVEFLKMENDILKKVKALLKN